MSEIDVMNKRLGVLRALHDEGQHDEVYASLVAHVGECARLEVQGKRLDTHARELSDRCRDLVDALDEARTRAGKAEADCAAADAIAESMSADLAALRAAVEAWADADRAAWAANSPQVDHDANLALRAAGSLLHSAIGRVPPGEVQP